MMELPIGYSYHVIGSTVTPGQTISRDSIDIRRPGTGIQPKYFNEIIGKKVKTDIPKEVPLTFDMLE